MRTEKCNEIFLSLSILFMTSTFSFKSPLPRSPSIFYTCAPCAHSVSCWRQVCLLPCVLCCYTFVELVWELSLRWTLFFPRQSVIVAMRFFPCFFFCFCIWNINAWKEFLWIVKMIMEPHTLTHTHTNTKRTHKIQFNCLSLWWHSNDDTTRNKI